jgi:hypothetical protein
MKSPFLLIMVFIVASIYAQTPISSNRIQGSSIVLNNLSGSDVQKIMQGTIFDVFNLDLSGSDYNTELKRLTFLETSRGQDYQERLEVLRNRLSTQGIKTIPLARRSTTSQYITVISNYDVNKRGFNIRIGYNEFNRDGVPFQPGTTTDNINGFRIPNIIFPYFMPVPIDVAQRIEGNAKAVVQLQLAVDTFSIQKIFIINIDTFEVYAEADYGN